MRKCIINTLFLCIIGTTVAAQPLGDPLGSGAPLSPPTRALIIGISEYEDPKIPKLRYAHRDANAFYNFLVKQEWVAEKTDARLLTNEQATFGNLLKEFEWLLLESKSGDRAIIYFAGHGDKEKLTGDGLGYLLTYNTTHNNLMQSAAIHLSVLQRIVNKMAINGVNVVLITDACKSGTASGPMPGASDVTANMVRTFSQETMLLSCHPNELSEEGPAWGGGRGVFSYFLIQGLSGKADRNGDGEITVREIEIYVGDQVQKAVDNQLPLAVGDKNRVLAYVTPGKPKPDNQEALADKPIDAPKRGLNAPIEEKDEELEATIASFNEALEAEKLLEPMTECANFYYRNLLNHPKLKDSEKDELKYSLVAALADDSQEVYNKYLQADQEQLANYFKTDPKFSLYPAYLARACELIGKEHYLYETFKVRQLNFQMLVDRVKSSQATGENVKVARERLANQQKELKEYVSNLGSEYDYLQEDPTYFYNDAHTAFQDGNIDEAIAKANKAIYLSPRWAVPYSLLGIIYLNRGDYQQSERYHYKAVEYAVEGNLSYYKYQLSQTLAAQEYYQKAISLLESEKYSNPDFPEYWSALGVNYRMVFKFDEAESHIKKALTYEPQNPEFLYELGATYYAQDQYEKALPYFQMVLNLEPDKNRGICSLSKENIRIIKRMGIRLKTEEELQRQFGSNDDQFELPKDENGGIDVAQLSKWARESFDGQDYQNAEKWYRKVLEIQPDNISAIYELGRVLNNTGQYWETEMLYQNAISKINGKHPLLYIGLGNAQYQQKNFDAAVLSLKKAIEMDYTIAEAHYYLSQVYYEQGRYEEAEEAEQEYKFLKGG
jgi:tetratricopeptide (TPR) repeat protein